MSYLDDWVVHCADPFWSIARLPRGRLPPERVDELIEQADAHGVLGALLQNFPSFATDPAFETGLEAAQRRHRANAAFSLMLTREADVLMVGMRDSAAAVVKGPVFARTIYPKTTLRCFTDIDVLIAPEALSRMNEALADRGFRMAESSPASGPREWKWLHRDNDRVMVEVQTDLIHANSLRDVMSLPFSLIADRPDGPAALLLVALIHGSGHQYERLQQVVDICQAARALQGEAEERRFEDLVRAANARFASVAGLGLAHSIFLEPRCREIARALGPVRHQRLAGVLLDQNVVMSTMDGRRASYGWRRQAFRWLIKQGAALAT